MQQPNKVTNILNPRSKYPKTRDSKIRICLWGSNPSNSFLNPSMAYFVADLGCCDSSDLLATVWMVARYSAGMLRAPVRYPVR